MDALIGVSAMVDMQKVKRVVYRHDWNNLSEWVGALDELADMTDEQISELVRPAGPPASERRLQ
jgi:hypothetical protein